jgi:predicted phage tail protein
MANRHYQVLVGNEDIDETELHNPIGQSDISIVPVIVGAGGGVGKTLLGIALIGVSLATGGGFSALFSEGLTNVFSSIGFNVGVGLTLMGVSEMLFPLPQPQDFTNEEDPRISFSFSGVQNTSRAGTSHPIAYGEIVTGSVVISAGIDTNQVQA